MSTHQVSYPRAEKKPIPENSPRPGTCRSKVGCDAMDAPCTNKIRPAGPDGSAPCLFHRNRRTSLPLLVQCFSPRSVAAGEKRVCTAELPVLTHRPNLADPGPGVG